MKHIATDLFLKKQEENLLRDFNKSPKILKKQINKPKKIEEKPLNEENLC